MTSLIAEREPSILLPTGGSDVDALLTEQETADWLKVSPRTLQAWRAQRVGPPYVLLGLKAIRYGRRHLNSYAESQTKYPGKGTANGSAVIPNLSPNDCATMLRHAAYIAEQAKRLHRPSVEVVNEIDEALARLNVASQFASEGHY